MEDALLKAKKYSRARYCSVIAQTLFCLAFFIIIGQSGISTYIAKTASSICRVYYPALAIYLFFIGVILNAALFPIEYLSSFKIEHVFGLSRQSFSSWLKDYAKSLVLGSIISLVMILILYSFLRSSGSFWWVYVALVYFFFSIVLAKIFPVIIIPLFYKLDKIEEAPLKDQLMALARKTGVEVLDVYKIALGEKTKKANAALCGLGATKRILLSDTLIENYTADEIAGTLAHELAHYKRRHFWKLSLLNFFLTLVGCGILNLILSAAVFNGTIGHAYEIGAFPLIITVFILYNIITLPLSNHISCRFETEADMLALGMTGKPAAFCDLLNKLSRQNLSDPHPSAIIKLFFYDHPPAAERIKACRRKADA